MHLRPQDVSNPSSLVEAPPISLQNRSTNVTAMSDNRKVIMSLKIT
jgi:hypothetical protein